jgi:hypothetical protein
VQLGEIVRPHQPDEAVFRPAPDQRAQRIDRIAGAEIALDRGDADRGAARLRARRAPAWRTAKCGEGRRARD